MLTVRAFISKG
ncbi:hypothetical protein D018_3663A, partial [Vibrio parahaemolyticus VP2007-007]